MKSLTRPLGSALFVIACLLPMWLGAASGVHSELPLVPREQAVEVDGVLDEWDTTAGILGARDPDGDYLDQSAWIYGMYDQEAVYLAFRVFDPTPLNSTVNPTLSSYGWLGDCVQVRFDTDQITHLTAWWYGPKNLPAVHVSIGEKPKATPDGLLKVLGDTQLWGGVEMAVASFDSPAPGYVQEIKIPWALITGNGKPPASGRMGMLIHVFYDGVENMFFEMVAERAGIERMIYEQSENWGEAVLVSGETAPVLDSILRNRWERVSVPQIGTLTEAVFLDENTGFLTGKHGILSTTNGGRSWNKTDIPAFAMWRMSFPSADVGYAIGMGAPKYPRAAGVVMATEDGGKHWKDLDKDFPVKLRRVAFADTNAGWVTTDREIFYTQDGGESWRISVRLPSTLIELFAFDISHALAVLESGATLKTEDGLSWHVQDSPGFEVQAAQRIPDSSSLIVVGDGQASISQDAGKAWSPVELPYEAGQCLSLAVYDEMRWALLTNRDGTQRIYETLDGGTSWHWMYDFQASEERLNQVGLESLAYAGNDLWVVGGGMVMASQVSLVYRLGEGVLLPETFHGPVPIHYDLDKDAYVTIVIEDEDGNRIRNLLNDQPRLAGENVDYWDGYNDRGDLMPVGTYRWRGLTHEGLHTYFEFVYNNPGNPAWNTPDGTGNWGSDHAPPQDATSSGDTVVLCWPFYEAGWGVVAVDLDGQRRWASPHRAIMGNAHWGGGSARVDADDEHVYVALQYDGKVGFYRLGLKDGEVVPFTWTEHGKKKSRIDQIVRQGDELASFEGEDMPHAWEALKSKGLDVRYALYGDRGDGNNLSGLAVGEKYIVLALWPDNRLMISDKATGQTVREIELAHPAGIDFAPDGRTLFAISDGAVVRIDVETGRKEVVIPEDSDLLSAPLEITYGEDGRLYVSDWGASMQVRVFSQQGAYLGSVGQDGGRGIHGRYDPNGMLLPMGSALDTKGKLWVAEYVYTPRRFSVWDADTGSLEKEYVGPTMYGGEGPVVCEWDRSIAFAPGMQFELDWETGDYKVTDVFSRAESDPKALFGGPSIIYAGMDKNVAKWANYPGSGKYIQYQGHEYFLERSPFPVLYEKKEGRWLPRVAIGSTHYFARRSYWSDKYILDAIPGYEFSPDGSIVRGGGTNAATLGDRSRALPEFNFIWVDANGDGLSQEDEFELIQESDKEEGALAYRWNGLGSIDEDLTIYTSIAKFPLHGFSENGTPIYQLSDAEVLPQRGDVLATRDERVISMSDPLVAYDADTLETEWVIPNPYKGVAGSHRAPAPHRGQFVGSFNISNDAPLDGEQGRVFHVTGNHGQHFLFTTDGLYISTLFADSRTGASQPSENRRGMNMDNTSFSQEGWSGYFWRDQESGNFYVIGGKTDYRICRVEGLETVQRLQGASIEFTSEERAEASRLVVEKQKGYLYKVSASDGEADAEAKTIPVTNIQQALGMDGDSDDWPAAKDDDTIQIVADDKQSATVRLGWDQERLYVFYDVKDPTPWMNSGKTYDSLFLSGDVVDLMLRTDPSATGNTPVPGDLRLLFGNLEGESIAVLYEADNPETEDPVVFVGVNTAKFERVRQLQGAEVTVGKSESGYTLEASVPWSDLGVTPESGMALQGDVGSLFSDNLGTETTRRLYFYNDDTQVVSDVGSEARLQPGNWGSMRLE